MLTEGSIGSDGAPENDTRLRHGGGDDVGIVAFLRRALVEKIAVGTPRFQSRFHRRSRYRQIEEPQRRLVGLEFSCHEAARTAHLAVQSILSDSEYAWADGEDCLRDGRPKTIPSTSCRFRERSQSKNDALEGEG